VIRLDVRDKPEIFIDDEEGFFKMVRAAFGQRRKTAANAISAGMGIPKENILKALASASLPLTVRAEALDMNELAELFGRIRGL